MNKTLMTLCLAASLLGCAAKEVYMVMPEENGKTGVVTVINNGKQTELRGAYSAAKISALGSTETLVLDPRQTKETFGAALSAQPMRPVSFTLYFIEGTDRWTQESSRAVDGVFSEIARRPSPEITVIGHTDTVGLTNDNDNLSVKRAEKVRAALIKLGIPSNNIAATGRGERELLIPTADETDEPRNRRVEISVR